jgi:hypothetical protein
MFGLPNRRTESTPIARRSALIERLESRALMSATAWAGPITLLPAVQLPAVQSTTSLLPAVQSTARPLPTVQITDGTSNTIMF